MKNIIVVVVADRFSNFASHAINESTKRGYRQNDRKVVSYNAIFFKENERITFYWANHNSPIALSESFKMDTDEVHLAGPEIDEEMVDTFESLRDLVKKKNKGLVKVVVNENVSKKRK